MKRIHKKILSLTLVLILLVQVLPINIVQANGNFYIEENDLLYSNKFVDLFCAGENDVYVALDENGDIWTWGRNDSGMFGDGSADRVYRRLPKKLEVGTKFKQISKGGYHFWVALDVNGNIWGCGLNNYAPLGNGFEYTGELLDVQYSLFQITSGIKFTKVETGFANVLALDVNGNIWGWGLNMDGVLMNEGKGNHIYSYSDGSDNIITRPLQLTTEKKYIDISTSNNSWSAAAAIDKDNNLYAWGSNSSCQLAKETTELSKSVIPIQIKSDTKFKKVSVGGRYVAALDTNDNLWQWGNASMINRNPEGEYDYDERAQAIYTPVKTDVKFTDIYSGNSVGYAKSADNQGAWVSNKYLVWGNNTGGGFGSEVDDSENSIPSGFGSAWINTLTNYKIIREGLALDENGYMWKWGFTYTNSEGKNVRALNPIQITGVNQYTVTFKDGDTVLSTQTVAHGEGATAPEAPTKVGYTFAGWDKTYNNVTSDLTVNATWRKNQYTVTFKDGDTVLSTQNVAYGEGATAPETPTKVGYTFAGWDKDFSNVTSDLTVNAKWTANTYKVTLNTNGGTIAEEENVTSYTYGIGATLPVPVKEGYTFAGWYKTEELAGEAINRIGTGATGDKEYYAKWEAGEGTVYKIEHYKQNLETNTYEKIDTDELTGKTGLNVVATPKTYVGYTENTNHEDRIASGVIKADGSLVLKLYYDVNQYTVTFKDGDTVLRTQTIAYGEGATAPEVPTKIGYTFAGWDKDFSNVTSDLEVKAKWNKNQYTVTFVSEGQTVKEETVAHGENATAPELTKDKYVLRWDKSFNNVTTNLTVNANWLKDTDGDGIPDIEDPDTQVEYKVKHYKQIGNTNEYRLEETERLTGQLGSTVTAVAKQYTGYVENKNVKERVPTGEVVEDGSLELKLFYDTIKLTVTFKDGDTVLNTQNIAYGEGAEAPAQPTKAGYTFAGWDKDFSNVTSNLEVNAKWTKNQEEQPKQVGYKVEHYKQNKQTNTYDKVAEDELTGTIGQTVTAQAKTYEGYTENASHLERVASGTVSSDGSLVLKLYYDINEYKVIFKDGDKVVKEETVEHGGNATPPTITKPGYILSWNNGTDNITKDTTFTAVWTKDPNYVDPNDGKEEKPSKLPQTGESYIVVGTISVLMSVAVLVYLKYRKLNNM